jgi:pimeloyl-ACP methyl ester carboxylesterase/class 3 adenylate cyclase
VSFTNEISYTKNGEVHLAYTTWGAGPIDLVWVPGFISHIEVAFENPHMVKLRERLGSFARVITFDKRGTGLSDRGIGVAPLEDYANDVVAVMDAAGVEKAAILGVSEGGSIGALFAATYPQRTSALIIYGGWARVAKSEDFPIGVPTEVLEAGVEFLAQKWGTGVGLRAWAPSVADDFDERQWWARFQRLAASPSDVRSIVTMTQRIDVRHVLPVISAPTLVLHRKDDRMVAAAGGRYLADHIPGAKYVELEGIDHFLWIGNQDEVVGEIEEFLTGGRHAPEPTRKLSTVLFTDIVGSTETAAAMGDTAWRDLLERHDSMIRRTLERFSGQEIKSTGDGFLAIFEGPTAAIRGADAIRGGASGLGCSVRAGIHTGEIELMGKDIGGLAVHIARRVGDLAGPGEIWVSPTVPGLAVGSGIEFEDRGSHSLKGVPGDWPLYSVR